MESLIRRAIALVALAAVLWSLASGDVISQGPVSAIASVLLALYLLAALANAGVCIANNYAPWLHHGAAGAMAIGAAGYISFVGWFIGPHVGLAVSAIVVVGSLCLWAIRGMSSGIDKTAWGLTAVIAIFYMALATDHGILPQPFDMIADRYWQVTDNQLPWLFMQKMIHGREGWDGVIFGDWHSSDRPPLETGLMLLLAPFAEDSWQPMCAQGIGLAANTLWVAALVAFLEGIGAPRRNAVFVTICVALTGPMFVNSVYVWPKLLAAVFSLLAVLTLVGVRPVTPKSASIATILFVFAMLSHGAIAFGLIGLLPLILRRDLFQPKVLIWAIVCASAVYSPWMAYQKLFDPPGDRLLKWHLADQVDITETPLLTLLHVTYDAPFSEILRWKIENVRMQFGVSKYSNVRDAWAIRGWAKSKAGHERQRQLAFVARSPGVALLGLLVLLWRRTRWAAALAAVCVATSIAFALIENGRSGMSTNWAHVAPMTLSICWMALCFGAASIHALPARVLLVLNAFLFAVLWMFGTGHMPANPTMKMEPYQLAPGMLSVAIFLGLAAWAWRLAKAPEPVTHDIAVTVSD